MTDEENEKKIRQDTLVEMSTVSDRNQMAYILAELRILNLQIKYLLAFHLNGGSQ